MRILLGNIYGHHGQGFGLSLAKVRDKSQGQTIINNHVSMTVHGGSGTGGEAYAPL